MGRKRQTFSEEQKARIAIEAIQERSTLSEIAQKYQVHPSRVTLASAIRLEKAGTGGNARGFSTAESNRPRSRQGEGIPTLSANRAVAV